MVMSLSTWVLGVNHEHPGRSDEACCLVSQVMILSHDRDKGRLSLSTKKLEPTPGDMLRNPQLVYEKVRNTYTGTHTHTHTHTHTCTHAHMHTCTQTYFEICSCVYFYYRRCVDKCPHVYMHIFESICRYTRVCIVRECTDGYGTGSPLRPELE